MIKLLGRRILDLGISHGFLEDIIYHIFSSRDFTVLRIYESSYCDSSQNGKVCAKPRALYINICRLALFSKALASVVCRTKLLPLLLLKFLGRLW